MIPKPRPTITKISCVVGTSLRTTPVGDSITFGAPGNIGGYRLPLFQANPGLNYQGREWSFGYNEGWSGFTISQISNQVLAYFQSLTAQQGAQLYLVIAGTNDLNTGGTAAATYSALITFAQNLMACPGAQSVLLGTIPVVPTITTAAAYNTLITSTPNPSAGVFTYDICGSLVFPTDFADSLHPNAAGYAKMAAAWDAPVKSYL